MINSWLESNDDFALEDRNCGHCPSVYGTTRPSKQGASVIGAFATVVEALTCRSSKAHGKPVGMVSACVACLDKG